MTTNSFRGLCLLVCWCITGLVHAAEVMIPITTRPDITVKVLSMHHEEGPVKGVVVLLPGGGGMNLMPNGGTRSGNFLSRARVVLRRWF